MRPSMVAIGLFSCGFAISCAAPQRSIEAPTASARTRSSMAFLDFDLVHDVYGVDPLTDAQADGRWHWELDSVDGVVVVAARQIAPTGAERARRTFTRGADATLAMTVITAYGVREAVVTIDKSGLETRTDRSAFVGTRGCYQRRVTADATGRRVEEQCIDPLGLATADTFGCERRRFTLGARNHPIGVKCLHDVGTPATYAADHFEARVTVDAIGQEIAYDYLDIDGRPKATGCARRAQTVHRNGRLSSTHCTAASGAFESSVRFAYDDNGCRTKRRLVDAKGAAVEHDGNAGELTKNDDKCSVIEEIFIDTQGRSIRTRPIRRYTLDTNGRRSELRCFAAGDLSRACEGPNGFDRGASVERFDRDERGRITLESCFDFTHRPAPCQAGYPSKEAFEDSADGQVHAHRYLDDPLRPSLAFGSAYSILHRDFAGRTISREDFGLAGEPVLSELGCHEIRFERDTHHRVLEVLCLGVNAQPMATRMCFEEVCWKGAARVEVARASESKRENVFYDVDGNELRRDSCDKSRCYW